MSDETKLNQSNLSLAGQSEDVRDLLAMAFTTYHLSESYRIIYKKDSDCAIPKRLIELYYKFINPDYNNMIYSFKNKYISNEILVEKNDTKEQRRGLNDVYQYIQDYDFSKKPLNLFITSLEINSILWKPTDELNSSSLKEEIEKLRSEAERLKNEAKKERDLSKFKRAQKLEEDARAMNYKSKIGGQLRSNNTYDGVRLNNMDIDVPSPEESLRIMNHYLDKDKIEEFNRVMMNDDIIEYISYCVVEMTKLIKTQPFFDGNKRTFRSLLNLMFKVKGLPPVYIRTGERDAYKNALYLAMKEENYSYIIGFYLFKVCDSIYELDVEPYSEKRLKEFSIENWPGRKK